MASEENLTNKAEVSGNQKPKEIKKLETSESVGAENVLFRVRDISEINAKASQQKGTAAKRKLPGWMLKQTDTKENDLDENTDNIKKSKILNLNPSTSLNKTESENASVIDSPLDVTENNVSTSNIDVTDFTKTDECEHIHSQNQSLMSCSSTMSNNTIKPTGLPTKENDMQESASSSSVGTTSSNSNNTIEATSVPSKENEMQENLSCDNYTPSSNAAVIPIVKIKSEPTETADNSTEASSSGTLNPPDIKPAVKVEKVEANSTTRQSCRYGIRCYRRNPMHRIEESHPGDHDYRRPSYPQPPDGTPECPFRNACYRRNPTHFQQYSHPPETDFDLNYKQFRMRLRRQQAQRINYNIDQIFDGDSDEGLDDDDPFSEDEDREYLPGMEEEDDEDFVI